MATAANRYGAQGARSKGYPLQRGGLSKRPRVIAANTNRNPVGRITPRVGHIGVPVSGALGGLSRAGMLALRGFSVAALPLAMLADWNAYVASQGQGTGNWTHPRYNRTLGPCWGTPTYRGLNSVSGCGSVRGLGNMVGSWPPSNTIMDFGVSAWSNIVASGTFMRINSSYTRISGGSSGTWVEGTIQLPPVVAPRVAPGYPDIMPSIDPLSVPVHAPMPVPVPVPVRFPKVRQNPNRSPVEQSQASNSVSPRLQPLPRTVTIVGGSTPTSTPPRKRISRKKDDKLLAKSKAGKAAMAIASGALNVVTETKDVVDILYDALPASVRARLKANPPLHVKISVIASNVGRIDWNEALPALAINQLEDKIVGRLEAAKVKAAEAGGFSRGYTLGGAHGNNLPSVEF